MGEQTSESPDGRQVVLKVALRRGGEFSVTLPIARDSCCFSPHPNSLVLTLPATPSCVSVTPSGRLAAVGTTDGTLHLLDAETGQVRNGVAGASLGAVGPRLDTVGQLARSAKVTSMSYLPPPPNTPRS